MQVLAKEFAYVYSEMNKALDAPGYSAEDRLCIVEQANEIYLKNLKEAVQRERNNHRDPAQVTNMYVQWSLYSIYFLKDVSKTEEFTRLVQQILPPLDHHSLNNMLHHQQTNKLQIYGLLQELLVRADLYHLSLALSQMEDFHQSGLLHHIQDALQQKFRFYKGQDARSISKTQFLGNFETFQSKIKQIHKEVKEKNCYSNLMGGLLDVMAGEQKAMEAAAGRDWHKSLVLFYLFKNPAPKEQDIQEYFSIQQDKLSLSTEDTQNLQVVMYKQFHQGSEYVLQQGGSHLVVFHVGDLLLRQRQARREFMHGYSQRVDLLLQFINNSPDYPLEILKPYLLETAVLLGKLDENGEPTQVYMDQLNKQLEKKMDLNNIPFKCLEETIFYFGQQPIPFFDNIIERYFLVQLDGKHYPWSLQALLSLDKTPLYIKLEEHVALTLEVDTTASQNIRQHLSEYQQNERLKELLEYLRLFDEINHLVMTNKPHLKQSQIESLVKLMGKETCPQQMKKVGLSHLGRLIEIGRLVLNEQQIFVIHSAMAQLQDSLGIDYSRLLYQVEMCLDI